tara:strand:+ start:73 stop:261 length:189 start_codon:yes stop_codon:yes gene_type:complete
MVTNKSKLVPTYTISFHSVSIEQVLSNNLPLLRLVKAVRQIDKIKITTMKGTELKEKLDKEN